MIFNEDGKFHSNLVKQKFNTVMKLVDELQAQNKIQTPLPAPFNNNRSKRRGSQGR